MKNIEIPAPVSIVLAEGSPVMEVTFPKFVVEHLDHYVEVKTPSQIRQVIKISNKIENAKVSVLLDEEDYKLLKAACDAVKFVPKAAKQLISYWDAIDAAKEV